MSSNPFAKLSAAPVDKSDVDSDAVRFPVPPRAVKPLPPPPSNAVMVFDFETVPDETRFPRPKFDPNATSVPGLGVDGFFGVCKTVADVSKYLERNQLSVEQYDALISAEKRSEKPRKGVFDALEDCKKTSLGAFDDWKKSCSVDPFKARIVAFGYALGSAQIETMTATNDDEERLIVAKFYELVANGRRRAGYNITNFDDLLVAVRGMILGVEPTVKLSRKKYGNNQSLDLMTLLFPNSSAEKLKDVCAALGINVPAGLEMDGSKVFDLYHAGEMQKIADYVASDVTVERELMWKLLEVFAE